MDTNSHELSEATDNHALVGRLTFVVTASSERRQAKTTAKERAETIRKNKASVKPVRSAPGPAGLRRGARSITFVSIRVNSWLGSQGAAKPISIGAPAFCASTIMALSGCTSMSL